MFYYLADNFIQSDLQQKQDPIQIYSTVVHGLAQMLSMDEDQSRVQGFA